MFAPATQPPHRQQQKKPTEAATSAEEEALKWNTDCVYFLASPLTCKKGAECEYRHSEYARVNPRDCYYWLNGNCMNPKCGFRHPPLEGLLGNQGAAPAGPTQPPHANAQPSVAKQPVPCVFFQKGMCVKGDMCSFLHTPNPVSYKRPPPAEAKPTADPQFSKKPFESSTVEKKSSDAKISKPVKSHTDFAAAPAAMSADPRDSGGVDGYVPKHLGYEAVPQRRGVGVSSFNEGRHSTQVLQKYGSDDNNSFHNGKETDDVLRESSPGFDVLVDNEPGNSEYYHVEDQYGRRSQEGGNSVNEYDPEFSAVTDGDREAFRDQRFDTYDQRQAWGHRRVSSERGDHLERRVYPEDKRSEQVRESDLRYRLSKQRRGNETRSEVGHDYAPDSLVERGYRDSRRDRARENSISSRRLQGRIKLPERNNGDEERRRERSRHSSQERQGSRLRDRIKDRLEDNNRVNEERGLRTPWERRREVEVERHSSFSAPKRAVEIKSAIEESKTEPILGKRKNTEEDQRHQRSRDSFAAPLPFSEILKRKRAAASGGSSNNKDETTQEPKEESLPKPEAEHDTKPEAEVTDPKPTHEAETEEGTVMEEEEEVGGEEEQALAYEGNGEEEAYDQNGEYYYEEGYEEDGEYNYAEGEEEIGYAAEEGEEAMEGEEEGGDDNKTVEMLS